MINYCNKLIMAPMVRGSNLPARLLALKYGADLIYTEELIDLSCLTSKRRVNDILGTIDYVSETNGYCIFRTSPSEKDRLVFQMGTANPQRAVALAKLVQNDVSAIDVNMGCPKPYSTDLGMGAALLINQEKAKNILTNLVKNINLPITCKIRIFDNVEDSIKLAKEFESIGISAIAVHGRTRRQRPSEPVNKDAIRQIADNLRIPVIANGGSDDIHCFDDIEQFRMDCGASSVMMARGVQKNISIFRKEGLIPFEDVVKEYLKLCVDYDNCVFNTKYAVKKFYQLNGENVCKKKFGRMFEDATTLEEVCRHWGLREYCREVQGAYAAKGLVHLPLTPWSNLPNVLLEYRKHLFTDDDITLASITYEGKYFKLEPKTVLKDYCEKNKLPVPVYETRRDNRLHYSVVTFDGRNFASLVWQRDKTFAEDSAALVVCHHLGLFEERFLVAAGCLLDREPNKQLVRSDEL